MNSDKNIISLNEHKLLFLTAFIAFVLTLFRGVIAFFSNNGNADGTFTIASMFDREEMMSPIYSFLGFFIISLFLFRVGTVQIIFSFITSLFLSCFYFSWFITTQRSILIFSKSPEAFDVKLNIIDYILIGSSFFDVLSFFLISILFIWQAIIIFRIISKERKLPLK